MIRRESFAATTEEFASKRKGLMEEYDANLYPHVADALKRVGIRSWENPLVEMAMKLFTALAREESDEWGPELETMRDAFEEELRATLQKTTPVPEERFNAQVETVTRWVSTAIINAATEAAVAADPDENVGLEWVTMEDEKVRASHREAAGQQVPRGHKFEVGDVKMYYPGEPVGDPANWINCRCVVRPAMLSSGSLTAAADSGDGFTSTVIVALPAEDDPVTGVSSEESGAHCTLLFLGDSSAFDVAPILAEVKAYTENFTGGPVTDKVGGRGTLGQDEADVVLLDAENLAELRGAILASEAVRAVHDGVEQFPTWIPHVTLGYPDAPATGDFAGESIRFDRIAVWHGEERTEFPLGGNGEGVKVTDSSEAEGNFAAKPVVEKPVDTEIPDDGEEVDEDGPDIPDDLADILVPWHGVLAPEGIPSGDGRMFSEGALTWRNLPLSLKAMFVDDEGHKGSTIGARIDRIWREGGEIRAEGVFDHSPSGYESIRMLAEGMWRGVSVDVDQAELAVEEYEDNGSRNLVFNKARISAATLCAIPAFAEAWVKLGPATESWPVVEEEKVPDVRDNPELSEEVKANLIEQYKGTVLDDQFRPVPPQTKDGPGWITHPDPTEDITNYWVDGRGAAKIRWGQGGDFNRCRRQLAKYVQNPDWLAGLCANLHYRALGVWPGQESGGKMAAMNMDPNAELPSVSLVASGAEDAISVEYFTNPNLKELTPLTITDDGHIFGHIAGWDTCHIGKYPCTTAPHTNMDYAYFLTGEVLTDAGYVPVGQITLGGGHAPDGISLRAALAHYDNLGTAFADVHCGEDEFGIWVSGKVREGVTKKQVHDMRAASVSGDWRGVIVGGAERLELVAVCAVNVPGFPIPRTRVAMSGERQTSLVAAGVVEPEKIIDTEKLERRAEVRNMAKALRVQALHAKLDAAKGGK